MREATALMVAKFRVFYCRLILTAMSHPTLIRYFIFQETLMKRILNSTALTITAFVLLTTVSVMAIERPFALNAKGVATFNIDGSGNPISGRQQLRHGNSSWLDHHRRDDQFHPRPC